MYARDESVEQAAERPKLLAHHFASCLPAATAYLPDEAAVARVLAYTVEARSSAKERQVESAQRRDSTGPARCSAAG